MYLWNTFRREFLIDRKIFNKSCKASMFGKKRNVQSQKQSSGGGWGITEKRFTVKLPANSV